MAEAGGWKQGLCNCCGDCGICEESSFLNLKSLFKQIWILKFKKYLFLSTSGDKRFCPGCCASFCNPCLTYTTANDLGKVILFLISPNPMSREVWTILSCNRVSFYSLSYFNKPDITKSFDNFILQSGILYMLLGCIMPCIPALLLRQEARERYNTCLKPSLTNSHKNCNIIPICTFPHG